MKNRFEQGDTVIYGSHGLCTLCEITERAFGGDVRKYYVLRPSYSGSSVFYVPTDSEALTAKMRRVKSAAQLRGVVASLCGKEDEWIEDDRARQTHLRQVLDGGDTDSLVGAVKSLHHRRLALVEAGKKLRAADDRLMKDIEKLLLDEFLIVFEMEREDLLPFLLGDTELAERA